MPGSSSEECRGQTAFHRMDAPLINMRRRALVCLQVMTKASQMRQHNKLHSTLILPPVIVL